MQPTEEQYTSIQYRTSSFIPLKFLGIVCRVFNSPQHNEDGNIYVNFNGTSEQFTFSSLLGQSLLSEVFNFILCAGSINSIHNGNLKF